MVVVEVFERSPEARLVSLRQANEIRSARAALKRKLRARLVNPVSLVCDPPDYLGSMKVEKFLQALPGVGPTKAHQLMLRTQVAPSKTLRGLSNRQRALLAELLTARLSAMQSHDPSPASTANGPGSSTEGV